MASVLGVLGLLLGALLALPAPAQAAGSLPCDLYAAGGTPCVAAHSTTRALFSSYNG
ncbi:alpha-L-arabinofuranosidase, partial [Streptomyces sp. SID11233]|nr:alpha-L-arabinofuranosidase [Streptomyces sp. SID11233]